MEHKTQPLSGLFRAAAVSALLAGTGLAAPQALAQDHGLRWGVVMDVSTLDPVYATNNWEIISAYNLYDPLLYPDAEAGVAPWIAESWEISEDGTRYTFVIREGLSFHDGSPITAEDVAFSMTRMLTLNGPGASNFRMLSTEGVSHDERSVTFTLAEPNSSFLRSMALFRIVNKDLVMANLAEGPHGAFQDYGQAFVRGNDAGSGPYRVAEYRPGERTRMELYPDYRLNPPRPETPAYAEFVITPELATIQTMLRAGELDLGDLTIPVRVQQELTAQPHIESREDPVPSPWYVIMNNAQPPLDDPFVRKAVASAYDRDTVVNHILGAGGPLAGPVPGAMLPGCEGITTYPFDLDVARDYLAQSKYSAEELAGFELEVAAVAGSERFNNIGLLLSANLNKIGLNTSVLPVRWADIVQAQTKPDTAYNFVIFFDVAKIGDPSLFLNYYTPRGFGDAYPPGGMYYENPQITDLVQTGLLSTDPEVQNASYCEATKLAAADSPSIFSHTDVRQIPYWDYVEGFTDSKGALFYDMRFDTWSLDLDSAELKANQD